MFPKTTYDHCWCTTHPHIFLQVKWIQYGHTATLCSFTSVIHFQKQKLPEIILDAFNYDLVDWPQNRKFCFGAGRPVPCWIHGAHKDMLDSCWLGVKFFCFLFLAHCSIFALIIESVILQSAKQVSLYSSKPQQRCTSWYTCTYC